MQQPYKLPILHCQNHMPADALATWRARPSAGIALTKYARIFRL